MPLQFRSDNETGRVLYTWWTSLEDNKGDRAALRRCRLPLEALFIPAYHHLHRDLTRHDSINDRRLPAVAALLAHVKEERIENEFAVQMAAPRSGGDTPRLSELRFRRLLQCQTLDDLFPALRRVVHLLDGHVDIYSLADSVYWWGENMRRRLAYAYYGALRS